MLITPPKQTSLLIFSALVFILMFGIGMASPIVPLYAASLGASWTEIGLMGTSWAVTLMLLAIVTGRLSDRFGRKPMIVASGVLSALAALSYLASSRVPYVIVVRIMEGAAWALFWPAAEAFSTEIVEPKMAGRAIGMTTASYGVAFATGSLAGGSIVGTFGFPQTFGAYCVISLLSVVVAMALLRDVGRHRAQSNREKKVSYDRSRPRTAFPAYFLGAAYTFGLGIVLTLFSVFAKDVGVSIFLIGVLFGVFWSGRIVGSFGGGRLSDEYGRKPIAVMAMCFSALGFGLIFASTDIYFLLAGVAALGFSIGAAFPVGVALISDTVSQSVRGYTMGVFETCCAAGFMTASTLGGFLADIYSPRAPYLLGAATSLASAMILALMRMKAK